MQRVYVMRARIAGRDLVKIGRSANPDKRARNLDSEVSRAAKWFSLHVQTWTRWSVAYQTPLMSIKRAGGVESLALSMFGLSAAPFIGREVFEVDGTFVGTVIPRGHLTVDNAIGSVKKAIDRELEFYK